MPVATLLRRSPSPRDKLTLFDQEPGSFWFGAYENVQVCVWSGSAGRADVERLGAVTDQLIQRYADGISCVHCVGPEPAPPDYHGQRAFIELTKRCVGAIACVAIVVESTGFWASMVRSVVTTVTLALPKRLLLRYCDSVDDAARWLTPKNESRTGVRVDPGELSEALLAAREAFNVLSERGTSP